MITDFLQHILDLTLNAPNNLPGNGLDFRWEIN